MRSLRSLTLLKKYIKDRCESEKITDGFMNLLENSMDAVQKGFLNSVRELQVEPSISVSSEGLNTRRYTILLNKCICDDCGGSDDFLNTIEGILTKVHIPADVIDWLRHNVIKRSEFFKKVYIYYSCDFGNEKYPRFKLYIESKRSSVMRMPFSNNVGNPLRTEPDIISAEWGETVRVARTYNAVRMNHSSLDFFLYEWFESSKVDSEKKKFIKIIQKTIGKEWCQDSVHIYRTNNSDKKILFRLRCKCPAYSDTEVHRESTISKYKSNLMEIANMYGWDKRFSKFLEGINDDQLSWIGFGKNLDDLEMVMYYNDVKYQKRVSSDFCSFNTIDGNDLLGKYRIDNGWCSASILEKVLDDNKMNGKYYKFYHDIVDTCGLRNSIWEVKYDYNGKYIGQRVYFSDHFVVENILKNTFQMSVFPYTSDYFMCSFDVDDNCSKTRMIYLDGQPGNFQLGTIHSYDGNQTQCIAGCKILQNTEDLISYLDNLKISKDILLGISLTENYNYVALSIDITGENMNKSVGINVIYVGLSLTDATDIMNLLKNPLGEYIKKKESVYNSMLFNVGYRIVNECIVESSIYGTL